MIFFPKIRKATTTTVLFCIFIHIDISVDVVCVWNRTTQNTLHITIVQNSTLKHMPSRSEIKIKLSYCAKRNGYSARYVIHKIPNNYGENNCLWSFVCVFFSVIIAVVVIFWRVCVCMLFFFSLCIFRFGLLFNCKNESRVFRRAHIQKCIPNWKWESEWLSSGIVLYVCIEAKAYTQVLCTHWKNKWI